MIYVLEAKINNSREVLAVSADLQELQHYREKLSATEVTESNVITLTQNFPLFVVEHRQVQNDVASAYFRYATPGGFLILLENTPDHSDDAQDAFSYYLFDDKYFRDLEAYGWIQPVLVDNSFLSGFREDESEDYLRRQHLAAVVWDYNFDALDVLFDRSMQQGSVQQRMDLAENGYVSLFSTMSYDMSCSKLTQTGVAYFLPLVEKAEALQGKNLWSMRAEAFINLMQNAVEHEPDKIVQYGLYAVDALNNQIQESPDASANQWQSLVYVYGELLEYDKLNQIQHWKSAIDCIHACIKIEVEQMRWEFYLRLVFGEIQGEDQILKDLRMGEMNKFLQSTESFAEHEAYHQLIIAVAYRNYIRQCEDEKRNVPIMLEVQALYWLDLAVFWNGDNKTTPITTTQAADFFRQEGIRLGRMDALEAALALCERHAGDTYRITRVREDIADLCLAQNDPSAASGQLHQAWQCYREVWQDSDDNFSYLIQYAEFLEKLYHTPFLADKPTLQDIRYIATRAEQEGKGYYGSPGFLLARLALLEDDEDEAIHLVTRELLLHELCIDNHILALKQNEHAESFYHLQKFLDAAVKFMNDVSLNYYFNPIISWNEVNNMSRKEVSEAWGDRMQEIRNREVIS